MKTPLLWSAFGLLTFSLTYTFKISRYVPNIYYTNLENLLFKTVSGCLRADVSYFLLLHAEKGRLRNAVANRVPASCWVPKILGTRCDRLTHSAHCLT